MNVIHTVPADTAVTVLVLLGPNATVAFVTSPLVHSPTKPPDAVTVTGLPGCTPPAPAIAGNGGNELIVTACDTLQLPNAYVMIAVPGFTPVTIPVPAPTVAFVTFELLHTPPPGLLVNVVVAD